MKYIFAVQFPIPRRLVSCFMTSSPDRVGSVDKSISLARTADASPFMYPTFALAVPITFYFFTGESGNAFGCNTSMT